MKLLNKNPHPCVAFRNLYIESRYLINKFFKFCNDTVFCLQWGLTIIIIIVLFLTSNTMAKVKKNASTIQYAYGKCGTQVRVFSRTLVNEKSTIEMRQRNRVRMQADHL